MYSSIVFLVFYFLILFFSKGRKSASKKWSVFLVVAIILFEIWNLRFDWQHIFKDLFFGFFLTGIGVVFMTLKFNFKYLINLLFIPLTLGYLNFIPTKKASDVVLYEKGELLVEVKDVAPINEFVQVNQLKIEKAFKNWEEEINGLEHYYLIDVPDNKIHLLESLKKKINDLPGVLYIEDNEVLTIQITNDPLLNNQWALIDYGFEDLESIISSDNFNPVKKSIIAILDTGVDAFHEDLKSAYWSDGQVDIKGHGTHCAGIAGAATNNNIGIASIGGVSNSVQVTGIKVLSDNGVGNQAGIIDGIIKAVHLGVDVISLSLGGFSNDAKQKAYEKAVQYANNNGVIVVAAAGNASRDAAKFTPANAKGVLTVSALDENNRLATFSNTLQNIEMGIAAPGQNILSTTPNDTYKTFSGTSMATPYVAGVVGILKSLKPNLSTKDVFELFQKTGTETPQTEVSGKIINPSKSIATIIENI